VPAIALTPLAWTALRLGTLAAVAVYASRRNASRPKDVEHERALDGLPEGVAGHTHRAEAERAVHGSARLKRVMRLAPGGPKVEVEFAGLGRLRLRRVG
jgi:hypothetical protein